MSGITDPQFATLQAERDKYGPKVTEAQMGAILNTTAWKHRAEGVGLERKDAGAIQPRTGITIWHGLRFIDAAGKHWGQDVLDGASVGRAKPYRGAVGPAEVTGPHGRVEPVQPDGAVIDPPPVIVPDTKPVDLAPVLAAIEALRKRGEEQHLELLADIAVMVTGFADALKQMETRLTAVAKQPYAGTGKVFGQTFAITLTPKEK